MITVLFHAQAKPGLQENLDAMFVRMTHATREKDDGCVNYTFHRRKDMPGHYFLYEQWRDRAALDGHVRHMIALLGPPPEGARLPRDLHELVADSEMAFYEVLA